MDYKTIMQGTLNIRKTTKFILLGFTFLSFVFCKTDNRQSLNKMPVDRELKSIKLEGTIVTKPQNIEKEYLTAKVNDIRSEDEETNLIILGGGKTKMDADKIKQKYESKSSALYTEVIGVVTVSLSDTIAGLNKGFYIATIGCVNNNFKTRMIVRYTNTYLEGVYSRKITLKKSQYNTIGSEIDFQPRERDDLDLLPKLINNCNKETGDCSFENFSEICSRETCVYESGIVKVEENFYSSYTKNIRYPIEPYDFDEVLYYILYKRKGFTELVDYDNLEDLENGNYKNDFYMDEQPIIEVLEDQEIKTRGNHYVEHIYIENGYVIYNYESGD